MPSRISRYLEIMTVLAQKDFKVRYRNSLLGFLWSLLNPLASMLILTLVFSILLRASIPNFAAWVLIGILVWRFFSIATNQGLFAIVGNAPLVGKMFVSRYVIVLSNTIANLLGAMLEFLALLPLLVLLGVSLTAHILFLPVILAYEFLLAFALSLSLSSLYLRYRDLNQVWDIALQLGFWLCPIVYDASLIPERYRFLYGLNPVTRLIDSTRKILLQHELPTVFDNAVILAGIGILLFVGFLIFRRLERHFAEEL